MSDIKKRSKLRGVGNAAVALFALSVVSVACVEASANAADEAIPGRSGTLVVTTIYPLQYFTERIGGGSVEVVNLVSPGVEAHDFEPTPSDIRMIDRADVVLYNGAGFEPWMGRALSNVSGGTRIVVEASKGGAVKDPHVWLDPMKALEQVKLIRDVLIEADVSKSETFTDGADILIEELRALDRKFADGLATCALTSFVTSHDAFGHLALRYGLDQIPVSGLSPEAEPPAGDFAELADEIQQIGAEFLLVEPIVNSRLLETLAAETDAKILTLHPLASLTVAEEQRAANYFSIMEENLSTLRTVLKCN